MEEKVMKECKVLALCSQKGGVGKTTSCVNLAVGLAKAGKKVFVIDNDPWNGKIKLILTPETPEDFAVMLRIPGWVNIFILIPGMIKEP